MRMKQLSRRSFGCLAVLLLATSMALADPPPKGSVTVYPVAISPSERIPDSMPVRLAEVVGLMLERAGMDRVEILEDPCSIRDAAGVQQAAKAFGDHVAEDSLKTDYALYCRIVGKPGEGIREISLVVVDATGHKVFAERADKQLFAAAKVKPTNPMTACVFIAGRLQSVWDLDDPLRADAPEGKMAERMKRRSGLPPQEELDAIGKRFDVLKARLRDGAVSVAVYPVHFWPGSSSEAARRLADLLDELDQWRAEAAKVELPLQVDGDPNEQKVLWDTARAFRKHLIEHPAEADYALLVDCGINPDGNQEREARHVHTMLSDRNGGWVLIDYQNSHHEDFQSIRPRTSDECNRLVVKRLAGRLAD